MSSLAGDDPRMLDDAAWDALVEAADPGSYLQLAAWAQVKAVNGWGARSGIAAGGRPATAAQVLVRRPAPLPWGFAYAPRGPVATTWTADGIGAFTDAVRADLPARAGRVSHLRIDPEIELDGPHDEGGSLRQALRRAGWRPSPPIQPASTRADRSARRRGRAVGRPPEEVAPVREQGADRRHPGRGRRG